MNKCTLILAAGILTASPQSFEVFASDIAVVAGQPQLQSRLEALGANLTCDFLDSLLWRSLAAISASDGEMFELTSLGAGEGLDADRARCVRLLNRTRRYLDRKWRDNVDYVMENDMNYLIAEQLFFYINHKWMVDYYIAGNAFPDDRIPGWTTNILGDLNNALFTESPYAPQALDMLEHSMHPFMALHGSDEKKRGIMGILTMLNLLRINPRD